MPVCIQFTLNITTGSHRYNFQTIKLLYSGVICCNIQGVSEGIVNILGGGSVGEL